MFLYIYVCNLNIFNTSLIFLMILAVILMLLALLHCLVLFRCLQHMNEIYKIFVLICFCKSDVIKLMLFSTKNLLKVTIVTLI